MADSSVLINFSQLLASYLARYYLEYYLTCVFVVYETQYVQNLGQYGVDRDFSASKNQSEEKVSGI